MCADQPCSLYTHVALLCERWCVGAAVDGWVVFCTNLHEEATTEDLQEVFCEFGEVRNSWMNLDRQTGYVKVSVAVQVNCMISSS